MTCGAPCLIIGHNHPEALNPQDDTVIATLLAEQLLGEYGPDSFIGRVGSVLAAASETTFYAIAVYYGAVGIRRTRHTMAAALTGDLTAALVSALAVRLLLGV